MLAVDAHTGQAVEPVFRGGRLPSGRGNPQTPVGLPFRNGIAVEEQPHTVGVRVSAFRGFAAHKCATDCLRNFSHLLPFSFEVSGLELQSIYHRLLSKQVLLCFCFYSVFLVCQIHYDVNHKQKDNQREHIIIYYYIIIYSIII